MPEEDTAGTEPEILAEHRGAVLLLTLNRPDQLNAWTPDMQHRYVELLERAEQDPHVRAIVLTGAGRGFCAGADVAAAGPPGTDGHPRSDHSPSLPIRLRKPVIAAINGTVAGVGLVAALFTDVRFAAADATFTTAFSRRGLAAEHGIAWLLPKLVGLSTALDLLLSARTLPGTEARELGLVDRVLPRGDVLEAALSYAHTLATECSPAAMAEIKQQIYSGLDTGLETAVSDSGERMMAALRGSADTESKRSDRAKRPPQFPPLE
ncbi:enoyl-CoA hydratase [Halopolyspora algeriensis]|uniref:Enoyl-CoA hydratase n=1 Tax=Halopolyspora algeriensis TaxID=1500506 RepID=A0A368VHF7_9ACTN|nr:enoyl-CoA hydratase-related protein [Halopolyspora algeriensis]RCW38441.1 enoyl-CoA hydratase [Halopolyspora algeriensis]TQM55756.1 enoyl-CoA hydratase [Halopolyspora algeriensis]